MAEIRNEQSLDAFRDEIRAMNRGQFIAQQCSQQGAVHAISTLLQIGCTEQNAADMLASLRDCADLLREEEERRGMTALFDRDQTVFN